MGQSSGQGAQGAPGGASSNMYGQPTPGNSMQGYGGGAYGGQQPMMGNYGGMTNQMRAMPYGQSMGMQRNGQQAGATSDWSPPAWGAPAWRQMAGGAAPDAPPPGVGAPIADSMSPEGAATANPLDPASAATAQTSLAPWDAQRLGVAQDAQGYGRRMPGRGPPWGGMFGGGGRWGGGGRRY